MAPVLDRLLHLGRRRPEPDRPPADQRTVDIDALPLEGATSGPASMLLPAAIFRQVLFDPTDFTPAWLRARPGPAPAPGPARASDPMVDETAVGGSRSTVEPQPAKRSRRPKTNASPDPKPPRSKGMAKPDHGAAR